MAYTKSPEISTYSTVSFPFAKELGSRGSNTSKDDDFVNLYYDVTVNKLTGEQSVYLTKRDGSTQYIAATGSGEIRGMYHWENQSKLYVAIEDDIYIYSTTTGSLSTTLSAAFMTSSGKVGFTEFLYDTGITKVVATDGTTLITIDSGDVKATSVSANLPAHDPNPVYIDGYLLVLKNSTADFYNSDLNNPLLWTPGNFLTAEMIPDLGIRLGRLANYLLVFGRKSIEYFYDAGIADGSPFQRNDAYVKYIGYLGGYSELAGRVYFVGSNSDSQPDVFMLENSSVKPVGNQAIRTHLASLTSFSSMFGCIVSISGNDFYVINTGSSCYSLNLSSGLWARWAFGNSSNFAINYAINVETNSEYKTLFTKVGDRVVYKFSPSLYQDNGTNFTWTLVTDTEDFGTYNQKVMNRLILITDKPTSSATVNVSWTDDDYQNYNTPISLDLYQSLPCLYRLGRFRRRALKLTGAFNHPFRLKRIEVDLNKGQT